MGKQVVDQTVFRSAMIMITTFLSFLALFTIILGAMGLDFITALSGAASALANVGPGIGEIIGPSGNYSSLEDSEKFVLIIAMILGRLELLVVMALFMQFYGEINLGFTFLMEMIMEKVFQSAEKAIQEVNF